NALVLKRLIALFRTLHAFTSDADPGDVVVQGKAIASAAGATSGFVGAVGGGLAGGAAVEGGIHLATPKKTPPIPPHEIPPAKGDGSKVTAKPPETKPAATGAPDTAAEGAKPPAAAPDVTTPAAAAPETGKPAVSPDVTATPAGPEATKPVPDAPESIADTK